MNPGIFYLYEYENGRRTRNVGFIRLARSSRSFSLQLRARGLPSSITPTLELWAFYRAENRLPGKKLPLSPCCGKSISVVLDLSDSDLPDGRDLSGIDGFFLRPAAGRPDLFWMASPYFFDVTSDMLVPASDSPSDLPVPGSDTVSDMPEPASDEPVSPPEPEADVVSASGNEKSPVRKISHRDISLLPGRFWPLANNSFLLHGCHSYGHLILIEDRNRTWIGVPGIYDPREEYAASLHGFPRFTKEYVPLLSLSEEEKSEDPNFGYWCRCLGQGAFL